MKTKTTFLLRNKIHKSGRSHDVKLISIKGIKIKLTYEAYNAVERLTGYSFVNNKWEHLLDMVDLGVLPNSSNYNLLNEKQRESRANELFDKANEFLIILF